MGESKTKIKLRARLIAAQPWCIYCGGTRPAETVDHMPPIAILVGRHRPKGLEFSCCERCNAGTKGADHLAAYLSRLYPDPVTREAKAEVGRLTKAVANNFPGLLEEMHPSAEQERQFQRQRNEFPADVHPLNLGGPLASAAIETFAAKLGLALHYHLTKTIAPESGRVGVRVFSNVEALTGRVPQSFLKLFPAGQTLRQGSLNVADQFRYSSVAATDGNVSAHLAVFREAFAVATTVAHTAESLSYIPSGFVYRPAEGGPTLVL